MGNFQERSWWSIQEEANEMKGSVTLMEFWIEHMESMEQVAKQKKSNIAEITQMINQVDDDLQTEKKEFQEIDDMAAKQFQELEQLINKFSEMTQKIKNVKMMEAIQRRIRVEQDWRMKTENEQKVRMASLIADMNQCIAKARAETLKKRS